MLRVLTVNALTDLVIPDAYAHITHEATVLGWPCMVSGGHTVAN